MSLLLCAAALVCSPLWAQQTGRIDGVAVIGRRLTTQHQRVRVYAEPGAQPELAPRTEENPLANVLIYLEPAPGLAGATPSASAPRPEMRQESEQFAPHVLPILAGSTVDFPNRDPIYHNVFSLSRAKSFDLGRFPQGGSKQIAFTKPGVVQVFCHIHADMSGYIIVLENAFFAVPSADGRFVLDRVPPGDYKLIAWHERIRPLVRSIHVSSGASTPIRIIIPLQDSLPAR
ncbi:MAG: carboxypeptidase regulatory-like domain-containing protein [Gemmatimonadota bacterium]